MSQIVIVTTDAGISEPHFKCDHCGKLIKQAAEANLVWSSPLDGPPVNAKIVCKAYACEKGVKILAHKFEFPNWMELDVAWLCLKNNSHINLKETARKAAILEAIG